MSSYNSCTLGKVGKTGPNLDGIIFGVIKSDCVGALANMNRRLSGNDL